jgi:dTDP-glucose pyrophosphorylase
MSARFEKSCVREDRSLRDVMQAIESANAQIALIVDASGRLVGTMTDGDVRRALLGGATMDAPLLPFVQRKFVSVTPTAGRAEVLELMHARTVGQIPIVDAQGTLTGLHLLHELLGPRERPNIAVIMAGGKGERLLPLTKSLPKPMLPVAGRPILERIVLHLVSHGFRRIYIAVRYLAEVIEAHFKDGAALGCRIEYLRETEPLGTGGALSLLPEGIVDPLLVLNGDLIVQLNLGELLAFHSRGGFQATVATYTHTYTVPFGVVEIEGDRVSSLSEKPTQAWRTNAGIYVLEPNLLSRVPKKTDFPLPALLEDCLQRGESVGAHSASAEWIDVGQGSELGRARGVKQ